MTLIEIILPVRNPTEVFRRTIDSVIAQSSRNFSVLVSDNWSNSGGEFIQESLTRLTAAGITSRLVRPPVEIGRVEHWNWSHQQSSAEWIKPLFVGDWLESSCIETYVTAAQAEPAVDIINSSFGVHHTDGRVESVSYPGGYRSPEQALADAFRSGNCFGGPINVCLRRLAFGLVGGYPPALPVSADFWVIIMLALRKGIRTCPEVLSHFNYHPARFSTNFPWGRIHGDRELFVILLAATSAANFAEIPVRRKVRNRFFWQLFRRTAKRWLQHRIGR